MEKDIKEKYKRDNEAKKEVVNEEKPPKGTTDEEVAKIVKKIKKAIKDEITQDPDGIGYQGKTAEQIATLLNADRGVDEDGNVKVARCNSILIGISYAPNALTAEDVTKALE